MVPWYLHYCILKKLYSTFSLSVRNQNGGSHPVMDHDPIGGGGGAKTSHSMLGILGCTSIPSGG